MSVKLINVNEVEADWNSQLKLIKVSEKKYDVRYGDKFTHLALEVGPQSSKLYDGFFSFGIKQDSLRKFPTLGIVLEGQNAQSYVDLFNKLEEFVSSNIGDFVHPILYSPKDSDADVKIVSFKLKCDKNVQKIYTTFKHADGEVLSMSFHQPMRGVYYVFVDSVTLSQNGNWYINMILDNAIVYKKPTITPTKTWN